MSLNVQAFREDLRKFAVVKTNDLRRLLLDDQNKKTFTKNGLSLNGRGIVNTAIAIANSRENLDRYKTFQQKQTTLAGFSFAFDFSGSMGFVLDSNEDRPRRANIKEMSRYKALVYAMESLLNIVTPFGIKSYIGGVLFDHTRNYSSAQFETSTDAIQIHLKVIKKDTERFDIEKAFTGVQPNNNTYLCAYAQGAIEMAKRIKGVDKRIAIYMTDGDDPYSIPYLKSLQDQAKAQGVELICAVLAIDIQNSMIDRLKNEGINLAVFKTPQEFISSLTEVLKTIYQA
jgi:hypothetical protein